MSLKMEDHIEDIIKAARDYLNSLVAEQEVSIRRITKDRYGRTVAELSKGRMNIQKRLVGKGWVRKDISALRRSMQVV